MIEMVVDGQPRARIVVSESASPVEQHAAAELNKYIYQMSGTQLPVGTTPSNDKANIYIGRATPTHTAATPNGDDCNKSGRSSNTNYSC